MLVGTGILDIPVWQITLLPAVIMLVQGATHDLHIPSRGSARIS